jgi:aromatic-L-amino-acid decarboxylase
MDSTAFRRLLHEVADWVADYAEEVRNFPVVPDLAPGEILSRLPAAPPQTREPFEDILGDFREIVVPGMTHWNHPGWFAYFPANNSPPSILAEILTAAMGAQCMSWETSPAATELEQVVMEWLRQMLGLPEGFRGVIQDTASTATLVALLSARERATDYAAGERGADAADRLRVYASTEAHSSVDKGVKLAGYGLANLRRIPVDEDFAMNPEALEEALSRDVEGGFVPACVVACVGTTSSSAVDPLGPMAEICKARGAWLHVDAAYAGTAAILPELRYILDGIEGVDSFVFNPHKWMFTNFDCSAYFVKDVEPLLRTFGMNPEYLRTEHDRAAVNFRDWGVQLGRRFRALKLWFVIRSYGVEGLRSIVRNHISWADAFRRRVEAHPDFEIMAPAPFGLVCFRLRPGGDAPEGAALDEANAALLRSVNATGRVHLTHTRLGGQYCIRLSVGQLNTTREDVLGAWELFCDKAKDVSVS